MRLLYAHDSEVPLLFTVYRSIHLYRYVWSYKGDFQCDFSETCTYIFQNVLHFNIIPIRVI